MNDNRIKSIIRSISNTDSANFFNKVCVALSRAIHADFVFIATIDEAKSTASAIAVANKCVVVDNFSYALEFTPCAEVADESICTHSCDIQRLYPNDLLLVEMNINGYVGIPLKNSAGEVHAILVALFENEIADVHEVETLFLLFSGLIEKELHKNLYIEKIEFSSNIIDNAHEAIMVCNLQKVITYVNSSFTRLTGYTQEELKNKTPKVLSSGKQTPAFYQKMWADIHRNGHWQGEIWNKQKSGLEYLEWLSITAVKNNNGEVTHYVGFFIDITEQHLAKEKIEYQRSHDSLTGLANKESLFNYIEQFIQYNSSNIPQTPSSALLAIDIDLFKKFNSLYSHEFGDKVLVYVAKELKTLAKGVDIAARSSGDNFSVFVSDLEDSDAIIHLVKHIFKAFEQSFLIDGINVKITFSIGIAYLYKDADDAHGLFEKAEQAMFASKDNGNNSYAVYNRTISEKERYEEALKRDLEYAIENEEFSVVYQPIMSMSKKLVTKCEALVRWENDGKWIPPDEFIPVAEKYGLISKIGNIVLNKACEQLSLLRSQGNNDIVFNINRSLYEFSSGAEGSTWLDTVKSYNLPAESICFELTESVLAPENEDYIHLLKTLQVAGCSIALDDFGTGYSSLSYLRRFPIDILKIDRSFISDMTKVEDDKVLVTAIISMAKALNILVVAEGVELKEEVEILSELGCDYIQGYYFSKPLSPAALSKYLSDFQYEIV